MKISVLFAAMLMCGAALGGTSSVNGSLSVEAGQTAGDVSTVNGSIRLADRASARDVSTVNGSVKLGEKAQAESLSTVNGQIRMAAGAKVKNDATLVNGTIVLDKGAEVGGDVSSVNGRIHLDAAHVGGNVETVMGSVEIGADSRIDGDLRVKKPKGMWFGGSGSEPTRVVIGPRATITGKLKFERPVKLYVSSSAKVGAIEGAEPIRFNGDRPPG